MGLLEKNIEERYSDRFLIDLDAKGLTLSEKDKPDPVGFSFGFIKDLNGLRFREKIIFMKRFNKVEDILQPIVKRLKIGQGDFTSTINGNSFISTIYQFNIINEIPGVTSAYIRDFSEFSLSDESAIKEVLRDIDTTIRFADENFFKQNNTLEAASDKESLMTDDERTDYLRNPVFIRKFIIDVLLRKAPDAAAYKDRIVARYQNAALKYPDVFKNLDTATEAVFKAMESYTA